MSLAEVMTPYRDEASSAVDRTPPQDMAAEQCVLGAMLMSKDAIADVIEALRGTDFYRPAHEQVFDVILDLYGRGEPADAITVSAELSKRGELGRVGGAPYLHTLLASVPVAANAGYYAEIVREKAILRRLVDASIKIGQLSYAAEGNVDAIVDRAQAEVYGVTERRTSEDYKALSELMQPTLDEMEAISSRGGQLAGVPTGFADLDDLTNGLHPGQMVIVAARPGMGKALALDTPLPTPTGWTTMGAVQVGEELLGADGRPTRVVAATDVMADRPCFAITFSDGTRVIADAQHEWLASSRASRRAAAERREPPDTDDRAGVDGVLRLARAADTQPERYVSMAELVEEVGSEFRPMLHSVGRQVGPAVVVLPAAAGELGTQAVRRPVYPRRAVLSALAHRLNRPGHARTEVEHAQQITTSEMAQQVQLGDGRANWAVPLAAPLDLGDAELPLDPYALGVWLGDGHSASAGLSPADPELAELLRARGWVERIPGGWGRPGHESVPGVLRRLGLLDDKHIPGAYLRGSVEQRRALMAGLLDASGAVGSSGQVEYVSPSHRLATDVHELALSLGNRAQGQILHGRAPAPTAYGVSFAAADDAFRVRPKVRQHRTQRPASWAQSGSRDVVAVEPVASVPVRCVQVDNPEHLYLATRSMIPTHNSTLALDLARTASIRHGLTSVIFSLEMSQIEITMRLLSAEASIPLSHIRGGRMSDEDWSRVAVKMGQVSEAPLFIDDSPNLTMMEIRAKARRLKQRHDLKLVVIDYIQLMTSGKRVESRQLEVSEFSRQIKLLAKELDLPVVALSQLNRGPEQRTDKRPLLADLRESGSLEQDSDLVVLLNRPDLHDKDSDRAGEADFDVAKHRNGPTKTITVAFQGHYSRFTDMQY